ncbi:cache domain-containing protein, partial [Acidovorax sp.]|uniref:cache domain-containing protein n=1 Tax=Acidovorax sp. TaxID=1872122 RepID=UPI00391F523B
MAVLAVSATLVWNGRQVALADSQAQAFRFLAGAEAALNRSLLEVDVLLAGIDELLELSSKRAGQIDARSASHRLRGMALQNLMVRYAAVLDAEGKSLVSSDAGGARMASRLPDGFLDEVVAQPISTLLISAPMVSFASSERVLYLARQLRLADQSVVVAIAELPVSAISEVLLQGAEIRGLQVTLERAGGQLLLSAPGRDDSVPAVLSPPLDELAVLGQQWQAPARLTGAPALVVSRPILYQDLRVAVSIPLDEALLPWRSQSKEVGLTALLFVVMIIVAGWTTLRYLERLA